MILSRPLTEAIESHNTWIRNRGSLHWLLASCLELAVHRLPEIELFLADVVEDAFSENLLWVRLLPSEESGDPQLGRLRHFGELIERGCVGLSVVVPQHAESPGVCVAVPDNHATLTVLQPDDEVFSFSCRTYLHPPTLEPARANEFRAMSSTP